MWLRGITGTFGPFPVNCDCRPSPAICAQEIGGRGHSQYYIEDDGKEILKKADNKPRYQVPSMAEIEAIPWNGHTVVSTFAGCGGSCLGFKMAGFRVLWANEFNEHAVECHKLNMPDCLLDNRDIRKIEAADILEACKIDRGELDVFNGSPPCDSFSTAGKREKGWGKVKDYSGGKRQRTDDLFFEYIRLLDGLQPRAFVAENVSGMVKGKAKGYFKLVLAALKECGYRVKAKLLDAQWLGVPQMRQRIIFQGIRNDLDLEPVFPPPLSYRYTVRDATGDIGTVIYEMGGFARTDISTIPSKAITATQCRIKVEKRRKFTVEAEAWSPPAAAAKWDALKEGQTDKKNYSMHRAARNKPSPTILGPSGSGVHHPMERRRFSIAELKRICAFPDDFQLIGSYAKQWARLGMSVPPVMMYHIAKAILSILEEA
jgi:DNA (cytosine-5)-methyltransferase 1